jgi:hypothetical protein
MSIFEKIPKLSLILISFFIQKFEYFISTILTQILLNNFLSAHSFSPHSFSADYLISRAQTTLGQSESIQTPPNSGCQLLPPLVAPPCGNQEPSHVLIYPFKMGATHSSLLPKMKALNNFTRRRSFLLHDTISNSSSAL